MAAAQQAIQIFWLLGRAAIPGRRKGREITVGGGRVRRERVLAAASIFSVQRAIGCAVRPSIPSGAAFYTFGFAAAVPAILQHTLTPTRPRRCDPALLLTADVQL